MKRRSLLVLAVALAANAHADPIINFTVFTETIVIATDTFETSSGTVLFTTNDIGYSDWLSPVVASDLAGDSTLPAQVQSTASLIPQVSEYQFVTEQGPGYLVLGGVGPAIPDPYTVFPVTVSDALAAASGPGYSIVGPENATSIVSRSYSTGGFALDGSTLVEGTVTFNVYDENIVERPVAATPEPSMFALLGSGFLMLVLFARRKAAGATK